MEPRNDVRPRPTIAWPYAGGIVGYHLLALLALVPWFFTWSGVVLSLVGLFVFGTLGINLGYHRLLVAIYLSRAGVGSPSAGVSGAGSGTDERE